MLYGTFVSGMIKPIYEIKEIGSFILNWAPVNSLFS